MQTLTLLELRSISPARNRLLHYLMQRLSPEDTTVALNKPRKSNHHETISSSSSHPRSGLPLDMHLWAVEKLAPLRWQSQGHPIYPFDS